MIAGMLVDAVEISRQHSVSTLVAVDSDLSNREHIDIVCMKLLRMYSVYRGLLRISEPDGVSAANAIELLPDGAKETKFDRIIYDIRMNRTHSRC